jgi:uncharacterized protein involved in oxidation of intracellular sulfur
MKTLIILNEPAYGTERSYNGLRLGRSLVKSGQTDLRVFLMGDAVTVAMAGQKTPDGYYNLENMLRALSAGGVPIACCGTCIDARGVTEEMLTQGARRSSMAELTEWTLWADKVLTF